MLSQHEVIAPLEAPLDKACVDHFREIILCGAMAEADWDEVTYLKKRPQRAADAKSQKVRLSMKALISIKSALSCPPCTCLGREPSAEERRGCRNIKEM